MKEKEAYFNIQSSIKSFKNFAIYLKYFDDKKISLYFEPGLCSLLDFSEKSEITSNNFIYIFKFLVSVVLELRHYGYVHSDIKPANITLCKIGKYKYSFFSKSL